MKRVLLFLLFLTGCGPHSSNRPGSLNPGKISKRPATENEIQEVLRLNGLQVDDVAAGVLRIAAKSDGVPDFDQVLSLSCKEICRINKKGESK